jgi:hypothetical protein
LDKNLKDLKSRKTWRVISVKNKVMSLKKKGPVQSLKISLKEWEHLAPYCGKGARCSPSSILVLK